MMSTMLALNAYERCPAVITSRVSIPYHDSGWPISNQKPLHFPAFPKPSPPPHHRPLLHNYLQYRTVMSMYTIAFA